MKQTYKLIFIALLLLGLCVSGVQATAFSSWSAYGDAWTATNDTHTLIMWNTTGTHTWNTGEDRIVEYLVVAGGGGGSNYGGGGGAGGLLSGTGYSVSGNVNVTVGNGGVGESLNGGNSSFDNKTIGGGINAKGGGYGTSGTTAGKTGGSGGGARYSNSGGSGIAGQGNNGGDGGPNSGYYGGGGGGGAGAVGAAGTTTKGGNGGNGVQSNITGTLTYYSGGGGGGWQGSPSAAGATGGLGGGGNAGAGGAANPGIDGTNGLGGGGGAGHYYSVTAPANSYGGSGVVIIIYLTPPQPLSSFSSFNTAGSAPFTTYLYDTSTNLMGSETFGWVLGDGNTSTAKNLYYTWNKTGEYTVNHSVSNGVTTSYSQTNVTVGTPTPPVVAPVASFYGSPTTGNVPLTVSFTDVSSNTPTSWFWEFGDGTNSTLQNPSHAYTRSGFRTVNLTATNSAGANITVRSKFVRVN